MDPSNLHYQDNFPALKLSLEAKAIANAAKAKNAKRKEELLKVAEENSRKTLEDHKQKESQKQTETDSSNNVMEIDDEDVAEPEGVKIDRLQKETPPVQVTQEPTADHSTPTNIQKNPYQKGILRRSPSSANSSSNTSIPSNDNRNRTSYQQKLDKPIILKRGIQRAHVHRYDLRMTIKKHKSDDEEQPAIQNALQAFLEILLQADPKTIIPPYYELERGNKDIPDISSTFQISAIESFSTLKRYVTRLNSRDEKGNVYGSIIIAQTKPFHEIAERAAHSLQNQGFGIWPKSCDHEISTDIGWFLYSLRQQDDQRLSTLLSDLIQEPIGLKWKQIRTTTGYVKRDPNDTSEKAKALHVEGPADRAHEIRAKLSQYYGASSTVFPDGTKMRFIPPFNTIVSSNNKMKFPTLVARQLAINQRIGTGTSGELVTYLALDKQNPNTGRTLRQVLMDIPSSNHENVPVFHSMDRQWRSENVITFTFLPDNESDAREYIAGLIPFLKASPDSWFLKFFSKDAKYLHRHNVWDPSTKQMFSTDEADINNFLCEDDAQNLSDEPTASKVEFQIPDVEVTGDKPSMYGEDSVSTFRSHA